MNHDSRRGHGSRGFGRHGGNRRRLASGPGDARRGNLKRRYDGGIAKISDVPLARHDLLARKYAFGAIQTTRGCPLNCTFCSVTAFNGTRYRQRPIPDVVREFQSVREKRVLMVDDNLIGTRQNMFRALAKEWGNQATTNFADDEELLALAAKAECRGMFIGFESLVPEGLLEVGKRFNLLKRRDSHASVRRIQQHNVLVVASFITGLDLDEPGIGKRIAQVASVRRGQSQCSLSNTIAQHMLVGPDEGGRPYCP